ncbi:MAG: hypothetical protein ACYC21_08135 [Eubacteriales bacterium]
MNKFKLFYDVLTTMKDKEVITGTLKVGGKKDMNKVFSLENEFEKNMVNGQTKIKLVTEMDCEGKKVKHESNTEFEMQGCPGHRHHCLMRHMHHHHNHGVKCGMKERLNKIVFLLDILKSIKFDEKEDQSVILSLSLNEIPEDMKMAVHEKMNNESTHTCNGHHFMKEFHNMENLNFDINLTINKNKEIEKIEFTAIGEQKVGLSDFHKMNIDAELNLAW